MEIKADIEKTAVSYQQHMINKIWAQAGMKALAEIAPDGHSSIHVPQAIQSSPIT